MAGSEEDSVALVNRESDNQNMHAAIATHNTYSNAAQNIYSRLLLHFVFALVLVSLAPRRVCFAVTRRIDRGTTASKTYCMANESPATIAHCAASASETVFGTAGACR